jgi:tetratricopeptide (TPR) repeat protein
MVKRLTMLILLVASGLLTAPFVYGASSGPSGPMGGDIRPPENTGLNNMPRRTPQQMAVSSYNAGLNHTKKAREYEDKAAAAKNDKDREKQLAKAKSQYEDAIEDYKKAIGYDDKAYQAMNELGFASRKIGDYKTALAAYNTALSVKPGFAPAIEYRGEAYLALSRFKDVQQAYLELVRIDQDHAATLMIAMEAWQELHAADATPEGKEFAAWVQERKAVAANTVSLSTNNVHSWN